MPCVIIMSNVMLVECHYAEFHNDACLKVGCSSSETHHAECH
jgi:hypothetical protein